MRSLKVILTGAVFASVSFAAVAQDAAPLSREEIRDLVARSVQGGNPDNAEVRYLGAPSNAAVATVPCCENVEEQVREETRVEETVTPIDVVTEREIIQPIVTTQIQPVEREIVRGRSEQVTAPTRFETERLPARVQAASVPQVRETVIPQQSIQTREELIETYEDAITDREIIQPIERTVIVPVERRILRPRTDVVQADTRFETRTAPVRIEADPIPQTREYTTPQVSVQTREEVSERYIDAVTEREIIQPIERTLIQPVERQVVRGGKETVTAPAQFREERLPARVQAASLPSVRETVIPQVTERTVLEVRDVYVDQVTRQVIQPVVVTTIQPVERRVVRGRAEQITAPVQYREERLPGRVIPAAVPQTREFVTPQVSERIVEEEVVTYIDATTEREIIQPIVVTQVQPIEVRRIRPQTERVVAPVRYEEVRVAAAQMTSGVPCACGTTMNIATANFVTLPATAEATCNTTTTSVMAQPVAFAAPSGAYHNRRVLNF